MFSFIMISYLLLVVIHASLDFFMYFMLIIHVASLGSIIEPFAFSCYLVVCMMAWIVISLVMAN